MFWQMKKGWLPVTEEAAIACKNQKSFLTNVNYMKDPAKEILARKKLGKTFRSSKTKKFFEIDNMSSSLPNNHITKALKTNGKSCLSRGIQGFKR